MFFVEWVSLGFMILYFHSRPIEAHATHTSVCQRITLTRQKRQQKPRVDKRFAVCRHGVSIEVASTNPSRSSPSFGLRQRRRQASNRQAPFPSRLASSA